METRFVKVVTVGALVEVSQKAGETPLKKRELVVESGYDLFRVTAFRESAELSYAVGDLAMMQLSFKVREYEGRFFQDITANDVALLSKKVNF